MGHPTAPLALLLLLLRPVSPTSPCFSLPPEPPSVLNLTNSSQGCAQLDLGPFQQQSKLLLGHNGIEALSPSSRVRPALVELDLSYNRLQDLPAALLSQAQGLQRLRLQHNQLRELPDGFFTNATALQNLWLEGNPLSAVPPTAFQPSLSLLSVPCRCDVVGSILAPCACSLPGCTVPQCQCLTSHHGPFNITDFHAQECRSNVGLVAGLAGAAGGVAVLLVVVALVCYRWRKAAIAVTGTGWCKREPTMAHGQPRYISRATEIGTTNTSTTPDYENVFVSPCTVPAAKRGWTPGWQEEQHSPQVPEDDNYFLESDTISGDQPIYANTQGPSDDIYIIPDRD